MPRRSPLPDDFASGPFHVADATGSGVSRGRLRARDLVSPFPGIRRPIDIPGSAITDYLPRMRPGQYFSGVTAAQIHGLYLPARLEASVLVHVTAVSPARAPRTTGVAGRQLQQGTAISVAMVGMMPVVSPVDTWCELASTLTVTELTIMGDGLVRRVRPVATMEQLADAVTRSAGRRGSRKLRAAFAQVRPGTDSRQETRLRLLIVAAGLPEPVVNYEIRNSLGRFLALGDLVYPRWKVLIEYDGAHHFATEAQGHHDVDRLELLMAEGWRVIRVHREHMADRASGRIRAIRQALIHAGWQPQTREKP